MKVWETSLGMRKVNGGKNFLTKMGWVMKDSSWEVMDDGGSFRKRKYERREGMEREALYEMAEEGPP